MLEEKIALDKKKTEKAKTFIRKLDGISKA